MAISERLARDIEEALEKGETVAKFRATVEDTLLSTFFSQRLPDSFNAKARHFCVFVRKMHSLAAEMKYPYSMIVGEVTVGELDGRIEEQIEDLKNDFLRNKSQEAGKMLSEKVLEAQVVHRALMLAVDYLQK